MLKRTVQPGAAGVYAAAITPRRERQVDVDLGAMLEVIDFLGAQPVQGIVLFGATGEFVHFTLEERSRYVALLAKRSRVPVMANVSHSTLDGAVMMVEEAMTAGIAGVLIMPPHYYRYSPGTVEAFLLEFASQAAKRLPVFLYNIPAFTDAISTESVERLMATGMFAGIKDSSGDPRVLEELIRIRAKHPFTLLVGHDRLFATARRKGADGAISGVACAVPELLVALDRMLCSGDEAKAETLDARLHEFLGAICELPVPAGIKSAAAVRGIKSGPLCAPPGPELQKKIENFQSWFRDWLPGVQSECRNAISV
jgi:dihydrodipicolinate synthase/N-acetylneuraminate lyase